MTSPLVIPRRPVKTALHYGREVYADTGWPVEEELGTHVVVRVVFDPEALATAIEADADAAVVRYPKSRIAKQRRAEHYETAEWVRARGTGRSWHGPFQSLRSAQTQVANLYRGAPDPGVRYEAAEIIEASTCPDCHRPRIYADGQWRHHPNYRTECDVRRREPDPAEEKPLQEGEFGIDTEAGYMVCGYCGQLFLWPEAILGHVTLTGYHMLGVETATGVLVVLAEGTTISGERDVLAHHCQKIPDEVRNTYAAAIAAALRQSSPTS